MLFRDLKVEEKDHISLSLTFNLTCIMHITGQMQNLQLNLGKMGDFQNLPLLVVGERMIFLIYKIHKNQISVNVFTTCQNH